MTKLVNCEDEQIHIPNQIQDFGFLFVFDQHLKLQYISENAIRIIKDESPDALLQIELLEFLDEYFNQEAEEIKYIIDHVKQHKNSKTISVKREDSSYYLSIYTDGQLLHLEFENQYPLSYKYNFSINYFEVIDRHKNIWHTLCEVVQEIIGYDRVMIYQFRNDHSGKVIAEKIKPGLESYLNYHYPEFDIPQQARALYLKKIFRTVPDIDSPRHRVISHQKTPLDLTFSNIRALSPIHLEYLRNAHVTASCSISIVINGKLWGLVACQNETANYVDVAARNQAIALTKYATNVYQSQQSNLWLKRSLILKRIELEVQSKSLLKNSIKEAIVENLSPLTKLLKADGIAFISNTTVFKYGETPDDTHILEINQKIVSRHKENLYASNNFYDAIHHELPFDAHAAGVLWISINTLRKESAIWFRKEQQQEITWAGKPQKVLAPTEEPDVLKVSPRNSFAAWKETVKGSAFPWTDNDLYVAEGLKDLALETSLMRMEEIKSLNNELKDLNYALDSYAYTISHDLKNPLSVLKLNTQMLLSRTEIDSEFLKKRASLMLEGINKMNDMIMNILELSRSKNIDIQLTLLNPIDTIKSIFADCIDNHQSPNCQLIIKNSLPIYIEKTMKYQVFSNLISNAVKYSSKCAEPKVIVDSYEQDNYVVYTIEDNGIGIIPEEADHLFKIFHRLSNAKEFNGSGVGLSIVQQIMKRLNGKISIEPSPTQGTLITLRFAHTDKIAEQ